MWPHPATVLVPGVEIPLLTPFEDRVDLITLRAPDYVRVGKFDLHFAAQLADDYLSLLRDESGMEMLVLGEDARLGRDRHAGIDQLKVITRRLGVRLKVVGTLSFGGPVGSALAKQAYSEGDFATAVKLLGRLPSYKGSVEKGDGRGRGLGFPTANIKIASELALPARGIYKGSAVIGDDPGRGRLRAVMSLGTRPTFLDDGDLLLEVHLLDFDEDVYGTEMRVFFEDLIRPEAKFSSEAELVDAMHGDVAAALALPEKSDELYEPWGTTGST
jgi:riboflavin kinase/FMN adenylyltransferase